ncbi:MAG: sugar phosphate isomerase/epimerase [Acidobacteriota bacterium]
MFNRREFLKTSVGTFGAAAAFGVAQPVARRVDLTLGFMLHALRVEAAKDLAGTLKRVADLGYYREIEMVSFKGYGGATARDGFAALASMPAAEARKIVTDAGFTIRSCHFKYAQFATPESTAESLAWAKELGTEYVTLGDVTPTATLDDWKRHFDHMNQLGEAVAKAGMRTGLHTQNDLWTVMDGELVLDRLLTAVPANHCQVELDLSSTQAMKIDPADYVRRHPGRVFAMHMRDAKTPAGTGYLPSVPLGQGDIDWRALLLAARAANVPNYIVEMQTQGGMDPVLAMKVSAEYLRGLTL